MDSIRTAAPQRHKWLTIYALLNGGGAGLDYELLSDAIDAGTVRITEVGQGTVGALLAVNEGERDEAHPARPLR